MAALLSGLFLNTGAVRLSGSIQIAIDRVVKFVGDPSKWPGQQITPVDPADMAIHLRRAITVFGDQRYRDALNALPKTTVESDRSALLYPDMSSRAKRGN
jgi:hypothetical protein